MSFFYTQTKYPNINYDTIRLENTTKDLFQMFDEAPRDTLPITFISYLNKVQEYNIEDLKNFGIFEGDTEDIMPNHRVFVEFLSCFGMFPFSELDISNLNTDSDKMNLCRIAKTNPHSLEDSQGTRIRKIDQVPNQSNESFYDRFNYVTEIFNTNEENSSMNNDEDANLKLEVPTIVFFLFDQENWFRPYFLNRNDENPQSIYISDILVYYPNNKTYLLRENYGKMILPNVTPGLFYSIKELGITVDVICDFIIINNEWIPKWNDQEVASFIRSRGDVIVRHDQLLLPLSEVNLAGKTLGIIGKFSEIIEKLDNSQVNVEINKICTKVQMRNKLEELSDHLSPFIFIIRADFGFFIILYIPHNCSPNHPLYSECTKFTYQWMKRTCNRVVLLPDSQDYPIDYPINKTIFTGVQGISTQEDRNQVAFNGNYNTINLVDSRSLTFFSCASDLKLTSQRHLKFSSIYSFLKWIKWMRTNYTIEYSIPESNTGPSKIEGQTNYVYNFMASNKVITQIEKVFFGEENISAKDSTNKAKTEIIITNIVTNIRGEIYFSCDVKPKEGKEPKLISYTFFKVNDSVKSSPSSALIYKPMVSTKIAELQFIDEHFQIINSWYIEKENSLLLWAYFNKSLNLYCIKEGFVDRVLPEPFYSCECNLYKNKILKASYSPLNKILVFIYYDNDQNAILGYINLNQDYNKRIVSRKVQDFWPIIIDNDFPYIDAQLEGMIINEFGNNAVLTFEIIKSNRNIKKKEHHFSIVDLQEMVPIKVSMLTNKCDGVLAPLHIDSEIIKFASLEKNNLLYYIYQRASEICQPYNRNQNLNETDINYDKIKEYCGIVNFRNKPIIVEESMVKKTRKNEPKLFFTSTEAENIDELINERLYEFNAQDAVQLHIMSIKKYGLSEYDRRISPNMAYYPIESVTLSIVTKLENLERLAEVIENETEFPTPLLVLPEGKYLVDDSNGCLKTNYKFYPNRYLMPLIAGMLNAPRPVVIHPIVDSSLNELIKQSGFSLDDEIIDSFIYNYFYEIRIQNYLSMAFLRVTTERQAYITTLIDIGTKNGYSILSALTGIPFTYIPKTSLTIGSSVLSVFDAPNGNFKNFIKQAIDRKTNTVQSTLEIDPKYTPSFINSIAQLYNIEDEDNYYDAAAFLSSVVGSNSVILTFNGGINSVQTFFSHLFQSERLAEFADIQNILSTKLINVSIICELGTNPLERTTYLNNLIRKMIKEHTYYNEDSQIVPILSRCSFKFFSCQGSSIQIANNLISECDILNPSILPKVKLTTEEYNENNISKKKPKLEITLGEMKQTMDIMYNLRKMAAIFSAQVDFGHYFETNDSS